MASDVSSCKSLPLKLNPHSPPIDSVLNQVIALQWFRWEWELMNCTSEPYKFSKYSRGQAKSQVASSTQQDAEIAAQDNPIYRKTTHITNMCWLANCLPNITSIQVSGENIWRYERGLLDILDYLPVAKIGLGLGTKFRPGSLCISYIHPLFLGISLFGLFQWSPSSSL